MRQFILLLLATCSGAVLSHAQGPDFRAAFASPPLDTRPGCCWYWINDNLSKEENDTLHSAII